MLIGIAPKCVVVLVGLSGSGKSTFAARLFRPTEILSSDAFRAMLSDDENNQSVSKAAFETLYRVASLRLGNGLVCVIDATNLRKKDRAEAIGLAGAHSCEAIAVVLDIPPESCAARMEERAYRRLSPADLKRQADRLKGSISGLDGEGFSRVYILKGEEEADGARIMRTGTPE